MDLLFRFFDFSGGIHIGIGVLFSATDSSLLPLRGLHLVLHSGWFKYSVDMERPIQNQWARVVTQSGL